jgi:hypothetical protein
MTLTLLTTLLAASANPGAKKVQGSIPAEDHQRVGHRPT